MDEIYEDSALTIIAAAGSDANYGLPGVSWRQRRPQQQIPVPGARLIQVFPHVADVVEKSTWSTRGWTYQEGLLPRRRLILTDNEAAFLCNRSFSPECLRGPLDVLTRRGTKPFKHIVPFLKSANADTIWALFQQQLQTYISRKLSKESDILNAGLGMLRSYVFGESDRIVWGRSIHHILGVPVRISNLLDGEALEVALAWVYPGHTVRRPEYPSWSWAGWRSEKQELCLPDALSLTGFASDAIQVLESGERNSLLNYIKNRASATVTRLQPSLSPVLSVTGLVVNLSFASPHPKNCRLKCKLLCVLPISNELIAVSPVHGHANLDSSAYMNAIGLVLYSNLGKHQRIRHILILLEVDGRYERAGVVVLSWVDYDNCGVPYVVYKGSEEVPVSEYHIRGNEEIWCEEKELRTLEIG